jgi:hypothetical protein
MPVTINAKRQHPGVLGDVRQTLQPHDRNTRAIVSTPRVNLL